MDISNLKNIVILKNLPSNIVEEAFVVLKTNKKIKTVKYLEDKNKEKDNKKIIENPKEYIIKEAELVVSDYISTIENKHSVENRRIEKKYKKLKFLTIGLIFFILLDILVHIFN